MHNFPWQGMNVLTVQDDQNWSDGSPVGFRTVDLTTLNGVMSQRHLLARQLSLKKQKASQHDPKFSSSIPDIYLLVVVSITIFIVFCSFACIYRVPCHGDD